MFRHQVLLPPWTESSALGSEAPESPESEASYPEQDRLGAFHLSVLASAPGRYRGGHSSLKAESVASIAAGSDKSSPRSVNYLIYS